MYLKTKQSSFPLSQYIENIVYYRDYNPAHSKEKLLPDGSINFIIDLSDQKKYVYLNEDDSNNYSLSKGWISGLRTKPIIIDAAHSHMMVITFKPGAAYHFFTIPLKEFKDLNVESDLIFGNDFVVLRDQLLNATDTDELFSIIETFLFTLLNKTNRNPFTEDIIFEKFYSEYLFKPVKDFADSTGYSHKHLISIFNKYIGISPKAYSRILKFQQLINKLENNSALNFASLAFELGYYDQAHLINEFRNFSGISPLAYINQKGEYVNYVPLT